MLAMNVAEGAEMLYMQAPRDRRLDVGEHSDEWVGGSSTRKIGKDLCEYVGHGFEQKVGRSAQVQIGMNYDVDVRGSTVMDLGITAGITARASITMDTTGIMRCSAASFMVSAPVVAFSSLPMLGGAMGDPVEESGMTINRKASLFAPEEVSLRSRDTTVRADPASLLLESKGVRVVAEGAQVHADDGRVVVEAQRELVLRCGTTELTITPDGLRIRGGSIHIEASENVEVSSAGATLSVPELSIESETMTIASTRIDITD